VVDELEIAQDGTISVPDELKGTYQDFTCSLPARMRLLVEHMLQLPPGAASLLSEAIDLLESNRTAAARRGRAQDAVQEQLHFAAQEISFLKDFIRKKGLEVPEFIRILA